MRSEREKMHTELLKTFRSRSPTQLIELEDTVTYVEMRNSKSLTTSDSLSLPDEMGKKGLVSIAIHRTLAKSLRV